MSPEQTGRTNRAVDQRSDLYSLGVTFYEMLTGELPFTPSDPLELVHCHLARTPVAPAQVAAVPEALSRLVMKLLAKDPEDRYQSAEGLLRDLGRCRAQWDAEGRVEVFALGTHALSQRWSLPQRLFGRADEAGRLLATFERVAAGGGPALVLVAGTAGVGKSALVNELLAPVARAGGVFLTGKLDERARRVPYATFVQALRGRIQDLLTESDEALGRWRARLQAALGAHGQVMVDLIPGLELVIGPQPPVPELAPAEAQARLASLFRKLLGAVVEPGRSLVLFLDDLQWADPASLRLLQETAGADARHLLVVGTYRDDEIGGDHPLAAAVRAIRAAGVSVEELNLRALTPAAIAELLAATLGRDRADVTELAALVHGKTLGNPFFARQFLTDLHQDGLIAYDATVDGWGWDAGRIAARDLAGNVAALMAGRIGRLAPATREAVGIAACVGPSCDLALLGALLACDEASVDEVMRDAVAEGLLVRLDRGYRFAHDRVREAAYESVPAAQRPARHLRVARALLQRTPEAALDDVVFEVANQMNLAASELGEATLRLRAADLNLRAGRRAKRGAAYGAAVAYLTDGLAFVEWTGEGHGALAFALELERAECELLDGHLDRAKVLLAALLARAGTPPQKVAIYRLRQGLFQLTGEIASAVEDERAGLRACGIELPAQPTDEDVAHERANIRRLLDAHPPESLLDLPALRDPDKRAATLLVTPSFFTDPRLFFVHVARLVALTIEHGLSDNASYWFSNYALALTAFGEYVDARRLAAVAHQLAARQPSTPRLPEAAFVLAQVSYWTDPYDTVIELYRASYRLGLQSGAIETPAMGACTVLMVRLARGDPLGELQSEADAYLAVLGRAGVRDMRDLVVFERQFIRRLRGLTRGLHTFDDAEFDGAQFAAALTPDRLTTAVCWCHILAQRAAYLAGDLGEARAAGERADALLWSTLALPPLYEYVLYRGLTLAASLDGERRDQWLAELRAHEAQLQRWAELNPGSFRHGHALVAGELARVEGRLTEASALFDGAAAVAAAGGFVLDEALAWELSARCQRDRGSEQLARLCLQEARACYARRDATAKVRALDAVLGEGARPPLAAPYVAQEQELDLLSVVRASQAISGEVTTDQVTHRLMELVLAEGGAERGTLLVPRDGGLVVAADAALAAHGTDVRVAEAPVDSAAVPLSLISYVWRTGEILILDDAAREPRFAGDEYVARMAPRSVLAMPIRRQGRAVGLLYLENRAVAGAFRPRRQVLELLAAQAAISLENAALLSQERVARAAATEAVRAREEFLSVASHELNTPLSSLTLSVQALRQTNWRGLADPDAAVRLADLIDRQTARLTRLVSDLLDVTRLQHKRLVLEIDVLELGALVRDVVARTAGPLERVHCPVTLALEPVQVRGDRGRLEQVLSNLLSNAMKFGAGQPIVVGVRRQGASALLTVADRGIGIDPARQGRIFDRFERGVSSAHYGGLGLGLYICREIVEAHGGAIRVESRPGEGAAFTVELPGI
jgi:predicted ATPase/signal transduction histidine kinase